MVTYLYKMGVSLTNSIIIGLPCDIIIMYTLLQILTRITL